MKRGSTRESILRWIGRYWRRRGEGRVEGRGDEYLKMYLDSNKGAVRAWREEHTKEVQEVSQEEQVDIFA